MNPARGRVLPLLVLLLASAGCDFTRDLTDRLGTCDETPVDLVNDPQTLGPVNIAGEGEDFRPENLLASGASRRIYVCIEKGDRKKFRALVGHEVVAVATCAASRSRYEAVVVSVRWTPIGLRCEGW